MMIPRPYVVTYCCAVIALMFAATVCVAGRGVDSVAAKTVYAQGKTWGVVDKTLLWVDSSSHVFDMGYLEAIKGHVIRDETIGGRTTVYNSANFPGSFRWTSVNSPLVRGDIKRVFVAGDNSIWMVNNECDVSVFNGSSWATIRIANAIDRNRLRFRHAALSDSVLRIVHEGGVAYVSTSDRKVTHKLSVSSWAGHKIKLSDNDTLYLDGILDGWYNLETGSSSLDESFLIRRYQSRDTDYRTNINEVIAAKDLRCVLLRDSAWTYGEKPQLVQSEDSDLYEELLSPLTNCVWNEVANDVAVDRNETIYLATSHGVFVIPNKLPDSAQNNLGLASDITISPNPASLSATIRGLNINSGQTIVSVVSSNGSVVFSMHTTESQLQLDVSALMPATYTLVFRTDKGQATMPLVIVR